MLLLNAVDNFVNVVNIKCYCEDSVGCHIMLSHGVSGLSSILHCSVWTPCEWISASV